MKIGEFSRLCGITKATARYYVNEGLLIPKEQGSQLNFTRREYDDFKYIVELKKMRFNLREIEAFLYLSRMSNMIEPDTIDEYLQLLLTKKESLQEEMQAIAASINMISMEIKNFQMRKDTPRNGLSGVPISMIPLLCCPECGKQLNISDANISNKYIHNGLLSCPCGYQATIVNGIVRTNNIYTGEYDWPDLNRKLYKEIDEVWAVCTQKCADLIMEEIENFQAQGKIILEANINGFFYTYNYIHQMPKDAKYIIVDKYEEVLSNYKNLIECLYPDIDILYIADASETPPIRQKSIDLLLSFYGESEHAFYHKVLEVESFRNLFKEDFFTVGSFISYNRDAKTRFNLMKKYPECSPRIACFDYFKIDYEKDNFVIKSKKIGTVTKTKKHHSFACHVDGEEMEIYFYKAWLNK